MNSGLKVSRAAATGELYRSATKGEAVEDGNAAYVAGCEAARTDIAAGRLVYRWSGHAGHWGHWIATQIEQRFGVGVDDSFGVCFVDQSTTSFNDGYNSVVIAEIDRRHGSGAFQAVLTESRRQSEESLGDAKILWMERHRVRQPGRK
jgi:hypothetical protein